MDDALAKPFVPYAPPPRLKPAGMLAQLYYLARNPIETWAKAHFEQPIVAGPSLIGHLVVLNDPTAIRHVLVDHAANYPKDRLQQRVLATGVSEGAGLGLLSAEGELWKRTRRTLAPLFTPRRVETFAGLMRERAEQRVERWLKRRPGAILEIDREMTGLTYDILSASLFSDALADDAEGFERELMRLLDTIGRIHPLDVLDAPKWLPRIGQQSARASRKWFESAIANLIERRRRIIAAGAQSPPDDLLTALMNASDPETGVGLSEAEVAANLFTLIAAGHETTARALGWTLYLLSQSPDWRARCEAEADRASENPGQWLETMPAMRAALEESMRLYPPVPHMSRMAREPDRIGDVEIPKDATIVIAPWLVHRHALLWTAPGAFVPDRFMPGAREAIDRFAYLPFGAGPRVCIGSIFAMQEAVVVLATIMRRVRLEHVGDPPRPVHRITLRPGRRLTMKMLAR